ncbi:MAG: TIGR03619 family F420-dependent LLM class oxidoreductase [Nitrososphaeraceae archaeon]
MKVGLSLPHIGEVASPDNIKNISIAAEKEGFDSLWVIERQLWPAEPQTPYPASPDGSWPTVYQNVYDPIETLTYVSAITSNIKLGTGIVDMLYQNPMILAKRLATLDNLSRGRLLLGLGLGHSKDEFDGSGVPFEKRGERADEFLTVLKKIWYTNGEIEHAEKYYTIPKSIINPKPYQKQIPIYLAGFSQNTFKRIIKFKANGWIGIPQIGLQIYKDGIEKLKQLAEKEEHYKIPLEFPTPLFPEITDNDSSENDRAIGNGSINQIVEDIYELEKLGAHHVYLDFDFSSSSMNLEKNFDWAIKILNKIKN